ncbi:MAG: hypothetical protein CBARDMAM_7355 [uncultured Caballeronia sp.]|nr:MAG: hypothetical protein CBARDMAM_7355 [uncultured Caballeronia sp.]
MLSYHADCTFPDFGRKLVRLVHGSIPSRVEASTKLGTVQIYRRRCFDLTTR